jgi:hypothetical protein
MDTYLVWTLLFGTFPAALWMVITIHRMESTLKQEIDMARLQQTKDFLQLRESHEDFHRRLMILEKRAEDIAVLAKKIAGK